jgi:hypothetical protein
MEAVTAVVVVVVVKSDGADRPIEGGIRRVTVRRMGVSMYPDELSDGCVKGLSCGDGWTSMGYYQAL